MRNGLIKHLSMFDRRYIIEVRFGIPNVREFARHFRIDGVMHSVTPVVNVGV